MKTPDACASLADIRLGIDTLDAEIVALLGRRLDYVLAAARFKTDEASIPAPERVAAMMPDRRLWAEQAGLDPDFVAGLFDILIPWFIQRQIIHWRQEYGQPQPIDGGAA